MDLSFLERGMNFTGYRIGLESMLCTYGKPAGSDGYFRRSAKADHSLNQGRRYLQGGTGIETDGSGKLKNW